MVLIVSKKIVIIFYLLPCFFVQFLELKKVKTTNDLVRSRGFYLCNVCETKFSNGYFLHIPLLDLTGDGHWE